MRWRNKIRGRVGGQKERNVRDWGKILGETQLVKVCRKGTD